MSVNESSQKPHQDNPYQDNSSPGHSPRGRPTTLPMEIYLVGSSLSRELSWWEIILAVRCPSGKLSWWGIVIVGVILVGSCPGGELSSGSSSGGEVSWWGIIQVGVLQLGVVLEPPRSHNQNHKIRFPIVSFQTFEYAGVSSVTAVLGLRAVVGDEEDQCVLGETISIQGIDHLTDRPVHLVHVIAIFTWIKEIDYLVDFPSKIQIIMKLRLFCQCDIFMEYSGTYTIVFFFFFFFFFWGGGIYYFDKTLQSILTTSRFASELWWRKERDVKMNERVVGVVVDEGDDVVDEGLGQVGVVVRLGDDHVSLHQNAFRDVGEVCKSLLE